MDSMVNIKFICLQHSLQQNTNGVWSCYHHGNWNYTQFSLTSADGMNIQLLFDDWTQFMLVKQLSS